MSKRLTTSAIVATLLMVATSVYSITQHGAESATATAPVLMGG